MESENKKPSNPSAFPYVDRSESQNTLMAFSDGMTLRDYFANSAMKAFISSPNIGEILRKHNCITIEDSDTAIVTTSYRLADAMLKQREL